MKQCFFLLNLKRCFSVTIQYVPFSYHLGLYIFYSSKGLQQPSKRNIFLGKEIAELNVPIPTKTKTVLPFIPRYVNEKTLHALTQKIIKLFFNTIIK